MMSAIRADLGAPFSMHLMPDYTDVAAGVVTWRRSVSGILKPRHIPQIFDAVICPDAIDVVDMLLRPLVIVDRPCNPMAQQRGAKHSCSDVASATHRASLLSRVFCVPVQCCRKWIGAASFTPNLFASFAPEKLPSLRLIAKQLTQQFRGNIGSVSHSALQCVVGQGRRLFAQLFRPVSYGRLTNYSQPLAEFCQ